MKPSYVDELGLLASSYAWASREDISPLTQLLDVASGATLYIREWWRAQMSAVPSSQTPHRCHLTSRRTVSSGSLLRALRGALPCGALSVACRAAQPFAVFVRACP
jgi:hypothetical protein